MDKRNISAVIAAVFFIILFAFAGGCAGSCTCVGNTSGTSSDSSYQSDTVGSNTSGLKSQTSGGDINGSLSSSGGNGTGTAQSDTSGTGTSQSDTSGTGTAQSDTSGGNTDTPAPDTSETPADSSKTDPPKTTTATIKTTVPKTDPPKTEAPSNDLSPPFIITPTADGKTVYDNGKAIIDASNSSKGYVMVKLPAAASGSYKIVLETPSGARYTYQLNNKGSYEVIPLSEGSGSYTIYALKQVSAGKGSALLKQQLSVSVSVSLLPFLTPNQFCMYDASSSCVALSSKLCGSGKTELEKAAAVYDYIINNIEYVSTAENAANGYIPNPDKVLANKSGICFDYSSLMCAMLRSQKIPTKVVVGYAGDVYHAWISVYTQSSGWIDGYIYFDGKGWNRMDPTYASGPSTNEGYKEIIEYISDSSNYTDMYYY